MLQEAVNRTTAAGRPLPRKGLRRHRGQRHDSSHHEEHVCFTELLKNEVDRVEPASDVCV